jgi:hypothetical protein
MAWTFSLTITNGTDRDLVVSGSNLYWGYWYTDNNDGRGPITVPAGQTVQAVGVRAAEGTWTGYEFSCVWKDNVPKQEFSYGSIVLSVNVPFDGSNTSSLYSTGLFQVGSWKPPTSSGHNFTCAITVSTPKYQVSDSTSEEDEHSYTSYLKKLYETNPTIQDWSSVERMLKEVDSFTINDNIPKQVDLISTLVGRSAPHDVKPEMWRGLADPIYRDPYAQNLGVKRYFAVTIYSVTTNPRAIVSLVRKETQKFSETIEVTTAIHNTLTLHWSIKESLSDKSAFPEVGMEVAQDFNQEFGVQNVLEVSTTKTTHIEEEQTFTAPDDSDLLIVPWVFSTAVLIYRESSHGEFGLVAGSEWAIAQIFKSYLLDHNATDQELALSKVYCEKKRLA